MVKRIIIIGATSGIGYGLLRFIGNEDINWDWLVVGLIGWRSFVSKIRSISR